jgi:hypothetical protein
MAEKKQFKKWRKKNSLKNGGKKLLKMAGKERGWNQWLAHAAR